MKILLIHQYFKESDIIGGSRFNEMTRIWHKEGNYISVIAGNLDVQSTKKAEYNGKFVTRQNQNGIDVWRCNVSEKYNVNFIGRLWAYFSFVISGSYVGLFKIKKRQYDIILVSSPPLFVGITAYLISVFKKIPFVFEVRDLWPESAIDTGVLKQKTIIRFAYWFEKFIYKKACAINVLTPAFYDKLTQVKNVPKEKLIMIPNAADFALSDELLLSFDRDKFREELGITDKFVIAYVGAHGVANGLDQILDAAMLLKDTSVIFILVGTGMQKEKLMAKAKELKIENVKFYNPVPKKEVLKFILSSEMGASVLLKNDTFKTVYSNKTFDYMSCKKPILMAIDGVSRKLVENADAGIFVEPENPQDFMKKIRFYLENPTEIKRQGENGYSYAKKNFDREILAEKYLQHLLNIKDACEG